MLKMPEQINSQPHPPPPLGDIFPEARPRVTFLCVCVGVSRINVTVTEAIILPAWEDIGANYDDVSE